MQTGSRQDKQHTAPVALFIYVIVYVMSMCAVNSFCRAHL